jgi:CRP-like cAMP-binding protein
MDEAKRQLLELIASCARKKDFKNAERLRERIYEIDPMALTEILQSGEIIEEEKSGAIDQDLLETWSGLLNVLTQDEFNDLYFTMEKREIRTGEILVSQGTTNDELFFINKGSLRISYFQIGTGGDKEIFLEDMESGQIAVENFFNATLWTVSLTTVQKTQISILKREDLERLEKKNPGIGSKLHGYCMRSFNIAGLLNRKRLDRRAYERYKVRRKIHLEITGKSGSVCSNFDGAMADISQGGFCFVVKILHKENSRLLLGRDIRATIPLSQGGEQKVDGTVIGLQLRDSINCDFSGHVKFKNVLERQPLKFIIE